MKKETKQLISLGLAYLATFIFVNDTVFSKIIGSCIFLGIIFFWKNSLFQWLKVKCNLFIDIRKRKYFYVTEKGHITDFSKRRELGNAIYGLTNTSFIGLILFFSVITSILNIQSTSIISVVIRGALYIALFGMVLALRNYLTGLYYYLLPWLVILGTIDYVGSYSSIRSIIVFIVVVLISYIVLTLLLPLHSLRKITSGTWIFGVLTTLVVPLFLEYFLKYYMVDTVYNELMTKPITIDSLEKLNISSDIVFFLKANPIALELMDRFRNISLSYELNAISAELSLMRFLLLTSYSLGTIIITLKIKLGESKAEDIYLKIKSSQNVRYSELRDCIFYGGERYKDKVMGDPYFEEIVISKEKSFGKYEENTWWIKYPSIFINKCSWILKRLI